MASYILSLEDRTDHLFARVTARFDSLALALAYWTEIAQECRRRGHDQVLVVRNVRVSAGRSDTFQIAGALRDLGYGRVRVAYVDQSPDAHASAAFGESIALQRGVEAQSFPTVERAQSWLNEAARRSEATRLVEAPAA